MIFLGLLLSFHHCAAFTIYCLREHLRFEFENEIHKIRYSSDFFVFFLQSQTDFKQKVKKDEVLESKFSVIKKTFQKWLHVPLLFANVNSFLGVLPHGRKSLLGWVLCLGSQKSKEGQGSFRGCSEGKGINQVMAQRGCVEGDSVRQEVCCCLVAKQLKGTTLLCGPIDSSPPGYSVHGIFQARIREWVVTSFSRGSTEALLHGGSSVRILITWNQKVTFNQARR